MVKRMGIAVLVGMIGLLCLEGAERLGAPHVLNFVPTAAAVVGRPLTPVSVAGVARRTARRCAVGVYNC
jgi:hypothetical protein